MECSAFCIMGQCGFSLNRFYIVLHSIYKLMLLWPFDKTVGQNI